MRSLTNWVCQNALLYVQWGLFGGVTMKVVEGLAGIVIQGLLCFGISSRETESYVSQPAKIYWGKAVLGHCQSA